MENSSPSANPNHGFQRNEMKWSPSEKSIARKVFDRALQREFAAIMEKVKQRATRLKAPSELWELERYLTKSRKEIDATYDYRYSMLPIVFGRLVREDRISIDELQGLSAEKLDYVRGVAELGKRWR
jgi:hypothetical protein